MKCCSKCFKDLEIQAIIKSIDKRGDCDFCGKRNTYIYDTDIDKGLILLFDELLDIYTPVSNLPSDFPREYLGLLKDILRSRWNIFNLETEKIYILIKELCREKYLEKPELFDSPVGILQVFQPEYLEENSVLKCFKWNEFLEYIKRVNRFHVDHFNKNMLDVFFQYVTKKYQTGSNFYRARICPDEIGFEKKEMGAPPAGVTEGGRANPAGISCLYVADSEKTTVHEIKAGLYDYISVGQFELLDDIEVVDLAGLEKISPFLGIDFTQHAINIEHLKNISNEIAKPMRRHDSPLDYLPTQYISEYIKSKGYDGVQYKSTMCEDGFNLAIFDESKFSCVSVNVYDVKSLSYHYVKLE